MNQHRYCATPVLYGMSWRRWKHFSLPHTIITLKTSISHIHSNAPQIRLLSCTHQHRKCHISVMHWTKIACLKSRYFSPYIFTSIPKYLHLYMRVFWVLNLIHTRAGRHKLQTHTHTYTYNNTHRIRNYCRRHNEMKYSGWWCFHKTMLCTCARRCRCRHTIHTIAFTLFNSILLLLYYKYIHVPCARCYILLLLLLLLFLNVQHTL